MVQFKSSSDANKYGLMGFEIGQVTASKTRDGRSFLNILFDTVELIGIPEHLVEVV